MKNIYIAIGALVALVVLFFLWQTFLRPMIPFFGEKGEVTIKEQTFSVDVAKTERALEKGLSGRNSMDEKNGMYFIFDKADYHSFWMKDMRFPIDIIFINDGKIVTIYKNVPIPTSETQLPPIYRPTNPVDHVLEINAGLADKYSFQVGDSVTTSL